MRTERQKIHKFLIDDGRDLGSLSNFQKWETAYFSLEKNAKSFWNWATKNKIKNGEKKGQFYTYKNWDEFVKTYCCDKTWAKNLPACKTSTDNTQTGDLPSWVPECLKKEFKLRKTTDTKQVVNEATTFNQYFWEDGYYRYKKKDGSKIDGKYECVNGKLYINTVIGDGQIYWEGEWKTLIEDKDLLKKIQGGGVIVDIIKDKFINLLDVSKAWTFKKIEELKQWWKEYKKNQNNDTDNDNNTDNDDLTPTSTEWLKDPTGSKMYVYQVNKNCKWLAKRVKTGKIFNISDKPKYQVSVDILNEAYPELIKNCQNQGNDNGGDNGGTSTPTGDTITQVVLPEWAKCIGSSIVGTVPTLDDKNEKIVMSPFGESRGFFWEDKTFIFVKKDGTKIKGIWMCDDNDLTIKTEDGEQWNKNTQWIKQISRNINPDKNYQDFTMSPSDIVGPEFSDSTSTQTTEKSDKSSTESKPKNIELPKEPIEKPEDDGYKSDLIDKYGKQNESKLDGLEKVLNEVNSLINNIEMKQIIKEQSESGVKAPAQELDIMYGNALLKSMGPVVCLCQNQPGECVPVNVDGKVYFVGRRRNLSSKLGGGVGYFVYDGRILKQGQGCDYSVVTGQNGPIRVDGIDPTLLELPMKNVLARFGINTSMYESNPYYYIDQITDRFKVLIEKGARSSAFGLWQDLLMNFYKYGPKEKRLDFIKGKNSEYDPMKDEMDKYSRMTTDNIGIRYIGKDILIYMPKGAGVTSKTSGATYSGCRQDLISYLVGAFEYERNGTNNTNINNSTVREQIRGCNNSGEYEKFEPVTQKDFDDLGVKLGKDLSPFKGVFTGFGNKLSFDNIKKLLSGTTKKLPQVGRYRNNPYLPFDIENKPGTFNESVLKNKIRQSLLSESQERKSKLLAEKKIIQTRTKILLENRILKFTEPRERFFSELVSELSYLEKQKFNKKLIKEEFWGKIKGLFGENGSQAVFGTFKDYMSKWLVGKLTSVNPNGWMGTSIKKSIKDIHIDDIDKLTDCDFMTKRVSLSITDEILNKMKNDEEIDGGISKIVKGGLTKSIDRTELLRSIEEGVSNIICSELGNVEKKLQAKAEEMKSKAIKP